MSKEKTLAAKEITHCMEAKHVHLPKQEKQGVHAITSGSGGESGKAGVKSSTGAGERQGSSI